MKDTHFLYGIAIFAVISIITVFIAYATDTLPKSTPIVVTAPTSKVLKQKKAAPTSKVLKQKKGCGCCSKKIDEIRKKMKKHIRANEEIDEIWIELVEDF